MFLFYFYFGCGGLRAYWSQFLGIASRMSQYPAITQHITQLIQSNGVTSRSIVFGAALGYAIPNGFWHHTPLIFLNPVGYSAYQVFVSQTHVVNWCKETIKTIRLS